LERHYQAEIKTERDREAFYSRAERALVWLNEFAPDEFRYRINQQPVPMELTEQQQQALQNLRQLIEQCDLADISPKDLNQKIYDEVIRATEIQPKEFFQVVYQKLISREQGPRLPSFLKEIGRERLLQLLV
jgi:lysyl-tRNA synthetase class 1